MSTVIMLVIIAIISIGIYFLIKKVCAPIKTITAILLIIPTVASCGIVLLIYKFLRNSIEVTGSPAKHSPSRTTYQAPVYNDQESKKTKTKKKATRSFDDGFGKITYYDEEGNMIGASLDNGYGQKNFTDEEGNYAGTSTSNTLGNTIYTDKDGNITSSNTNYKGDEAFEDGTTARKDSFGNTYYS